MREIEHEKKSNQNGENSNESNVLNCYRITLTLFFVRQFIYIYLFYLFKVSLHRYEQ
jgi:hypothetical protein